MNVFKVQYTFYSFKQNYVPMISNFRAQTLKKVPVRGAEGLKTRAVRGETVGQKPTLFGGTSAVTKCIGVSPLRIPPPLPGREGSLDPPIEKITKCFSRKVGPGGC